MATDDRDTYGLLLKVRELQAKLAQSRAAKSEWQHRALRSETGAKPNPVRYEDLHAIGKKHFGDEIPTAWYRAAREMELKHSFAKSEWPERNGVPTTKRGRRALAALKEKINEKQKRCEVA